MGEENSEKPNGSHSPRQALVIRYGALGDMIQTTAVFPYLTASGYEITMNCDERGMQIIENNPHVSYLLPHKAHSVPVEGLKAYWDRISDDYDYTARLSGTVIEGQLLFTSKQYMWQAGDRLRRRAASKHNYYEKMVETCGFDPIAPVRGEIYFTKTEREWARRLIKRHFRRKYVIVWAWTGSSIHKAYGYAGVVMNEMLRRWEDLIIITTGDVWCTGLEEDHPRVLHTAGEWSFRQSMSVIPYADLVIGPETGMLNAAGCFDTPKICMLTHSSKENLTKHWANDYSFQTPCDCSPCHRLFKYTGSSPFNQGVTNDDYDICPKSALGMPECMTAIPPEFLVDKIEEVRKNHG